MEPENDEVVFERPNVEDSREENSPNARERLMITILLSASYFGMGVCCTIIGPTLVDLERNTEAGNGDITLIFSSRAVGYLLGAIVGGLLFYYTNQICLISGSMVLSGVATAIVPWCRNLPFLMAMTLVQGIPLGVLDAGGNLLCFEMWSREIGLHTWAFQFLFGVGAYLGPLFVSPFLGDAPYNFNGSETNYLPVNQQMHINVTKAASVVTQTLHYAYLIIGVFLVIVSSGLLMFCSCSRPMSSSADRLQSRRVKPRSSRRYRVWFHVLLSVLLFFFYFLYVGIEVTYGGLVSKFAMVVFLWTKPNSAMFDSVFWGAYASARLISVVLTACVNPVAMLLVDVFISVISITGLASLEYVQDGAHSGISKESLFWGLTSTLGIGMGSVLPLSLLWIERYIKLPGFAVTIYIVAGGLGQLLIPALIGHVFAVKGPMWLMYLSCAALLLGLVVCAVSVILTCSLSSRYLQMSAAGEEEEVKEEGENLELLKFVEHDGRTAGAEDGSHVETDSAETDRHVPMISRPQQIEAI